MDETAVDRLDNLHKTFSFGLAPEQPTRFTDGYDIERQIEINTIRSYLNDERVVQALTEIILELKRAEEKHPLWPDDMVHAVSIMVGEAGECQKAANHLREGRQTEGKDSLLMTRWEGIQTGAMALRLLMNLPAMKEINK